MRSGPIVRPRDANKGSVLCPGVIVMKRSALAFFVFGLVAANLLSPQSDSQNIAGQYLGQQFPGTTAELFAPGFVSTGLSETVITFMPDGKECYWAVLLAGRMEAILTSKIENGKWTQPEVASFSGRYLDGWPAIKPDGKKLFFHSFRPIDGQTDPSPFINIWFMEREGDSWGRPHPLGPAINGNGHSCNPSIARNGNLYFSKTFPDGSEKICCSRFINGKYENLEPLPDNVNIGKVNYHAYISPDESFLIYPTEATPDRIGGGWNYYVSFRSRDDRWSDLINIGPTVNSGRCSDSASLSADGRYFFFLASTKENRVKSFGRRQTLAELIAREVKSPGPDDPSIYWIETIVIERLRPPGFRRL